MIKVLVKSRFKDEHIERFKKVSDKYEFVGPSIIPAKSEITKNRKYLIYVSMGTVINKQEKFFMNFIKAFQNKEDFQVIISTGKAINIEDFIQNYEKKSKLQFPQNIQMEQTVDQIAVLSKADVFVSHCGMNSVNESLFYKVPLVMIPQTTEQKGVANRVNQVGAGIFLKNENPKTIFDTVTQVLNNSTYSENAKIICEGGYKETVTDFSELEDYVYLRIYVIYEDSAVNISYTKDTEKTAESAFNSFVYADEEIKRTIINGVEVLYCYLDGTGSAVNITSPHWVVRFSVDKNLYEFELYSFEEESMIDYIGRIMRWQ